ncbi:site-specific integrase [Cellulomonas rhizosphaerae]|uniref:Site-specific integrase n=1 Tax=Cellulomonas rhizosphaerae TaxID=2293719 RepID=A0A413RPD6_9CELL|nr:site-specific integrase [Cellulomonas rhizosphaerae]
MTDAEGQPVSWTLPDPLPTPAGAGTNERLRVGVTASALGLPPGAGFELRWRTPNAANPRRRSYQADPVLGVAIAADIVRAAAQPACWSPNSDHLPARVEPEPAAPVPARFTAQPQAVLRGVDPASRAHVSPDNPLLIAVRDGQVALGSTVADVVDEIVNQRWPDWGPQHRSDMANKYDFLKQVMVYREPAASDTPEVTAWKRARLEIEGVELGASMHVALILVPDLADAIKVRRESNRRVDLLNAQAVAKFDEAWARYYNAVEAKKNKTWRGGRLPKMPPEVLKVYDPDTGVQARTEEAFAGALAAVLRQAANTGRLLAPNPWPAFAGSGGKRTGYRRPVVADVHQRQVPTIGQIVDLADAIRTTGPIDHSRNRHMGDRYAAYVLARTAGGRTSEYAGLHPSDFHRAAPELEFRRSVTFPTAEANAVDSSVHIANMLKGRPPGETRRVGLPTAVADAIAVHLEAGYHSDEFLFTGATGGVLRPGGSFLRCWNEAVARVFGESAEPSLKELGPRTLRKSAVTWLIRAGKSVTEAAELTGHKPEILLKHYAGVSGNRRAIHPWTGWDDAWAWASLERDET